MRPLRTEWSGTYLDGQTPVRHPAAIRILRHGLEITLADGRLLQWRYRELRQTQGFYAGEQVRLERGGALPEILLVAEAGFLHSLRRIGRESARRFHDPRSRARRVWLTAAAAVGAVALAAAVYFWVIPAVADAVALRVPAAWEERLGRSVASQLAPRESQCGTAAGREAIGEIMTRLLQPVGGTTYTFRVTVVNSATVNALAAPGGHLLLFRGLLERARTPEELAGVLAHEIQHVLHRDGTRALLRHASTGLLLAALSGDPTGVMSYGLEAAHALASLSYSRQAETEADIGGLRLLAAAGVSPAGMLAFFEQLLAEEQQIPQGLRYASSHPAAAERLVRLRTLSRELPSNPRPLLPDRNWEEVRSMCRDTRPPKTPFARP